MLFIKAYYYIFYTFVYSIVILCTVLSWLRKPTFNWNFGKRVTFKTNVLSMLHLHSQAG